MTFFYTNKILTNYFISWNEEDFVCSLRVNLHGFFFWKHYFLFINTFVEFLVD